MDPILLPMDNNINNEYLNEQLKLDNKERISSNDCYVNAYYVYLDTFYDSFLDKNGYYINEKKFYEMIDLPESISKNFLEYINYENNGMKRKKKFIESFFILFGSYIIRDKEITIKYLFNVFKKNIDNTATLSNIQNIIKDMIIFILIKAKNYNMETFLTLKHRIFQIVNRTFKGKSTLKLENFQKILLRNPLCFRVIQFLFHCVSPVSYELIKYVNKFLIGNNFDTKEHLYKIEKQDKIYKNYLTDKFINLAEYYEENSSNFNHIDEISMQEDYSKKDNPNKYSFSGSKDIFNLFKNKGNDFDFRYSNRNYESKLNRNKINVKHFTLEKKKYLPENFLNINKYKVERMYETIEIFQNKIRFPNINVTKLDSIFLDCLSRIQKFNKNCKKILNCFYYSDLDFDDLKKVEANVKFSKEDKSFIRIINKNIFFYLLKDTDEQIDSTNLRNLIILKNIKKFTIKQSNGYYYVSMKIEDHVCHNFVFFNFEQLYQFYFILKNNGIFDKILDKNILKETLEFKEIYEIIFDKDSILKKMIKNYQDNSLRSVCKSLIINFLDDTCVLSRGNLEKLIYFERIIELSDFKKVLITLRN